MPVVAASLRPLCLGIVGVKPRRYIPAMREPILRQAAFQPNQEAAGAEGTADFEGLIVADGGLDGQGCH